MTTTNDVARTEWSPPGPADLPRDTLQAQLEVYGETVLLRGFEGDRTWVRTVSADEIANVFIRHLDFSSGLLPDNALWWNQGETGQVVALWRPPQVWPVALQREAFQPPARLRLPMPGLVFVCSPGRAPWVYAALERPTNSEQQLYRAPAFNVFRDGRVCPGSHRFPEEVGRIPESFFQSFFSLTGDSQGRSKQHPDNLQALWEELDGKAEYPVEDLVPQCTVGHVMAVSEGRRGYLPTPSDGPAASAALTPVGYLVNHANGLAGSQGVGYDYVLGAGGLYVQSESAHLTARIPVAPAEVRGLAPVSEKLELAHGPIPAHVFELGLAWLLAAPGTERFFAVGWDGDAYRLVMPPQAGTGSSLTYQPTTGAVAEFHSHGRHSAFFSATDDGDEQGFRIYGVVGRLDSATPELTLRVGIYGHFAPLEWAQVFDGPHPTGLRLASEGTEPTPSCLNIRR